MQPVALSLWFVSLSAMRKRNEQDAARPAMQKRNKQHAARRNALKKNNYIKKKKKRMNWLENLIFEQTALQAVIVLSVIIAAGLGLGKIRICGISLGVTFVFFAGILAGHLGLSIDPSMLTFAESFGLVLFVYELGLQVGPGFFSSFRKGGVQLNMLGLGVILLGTVMTVAFSYLTPIPLRDMVGVLCGATTNTPALGAAQQMLKQLGQPTSGAALSCAVTYPLGVVGVILAMLMVRKLFVRPTDIDTADHEDNNQTYIATFQVRNPAVYGKSIKDAALLSHVRFVISRLWHDGKVSIPTSEMRLCPDDRLLVVTTERDAETLKILFGQQEEKDWNHGDIDWNAIDSQLESRTLVVSRPELNGKRLGSLRLRNSYGINISRVTRNGLKLLATPDLILQLGDRLTVVGEEKAIDNVEKVLGNAVKTLKDPNLAAIFIGIVLGLVLGSIPISVPGISTPVKLGLAGGPIVVGLLIGSFGPRFHLVTYTTRSANLMLRGIGLSLYLACLGLDAGAHFFETVVRPEGAMWIALGFAITFIPVVIMALVALRLTHLDFGSACGMLCGAMANPMALNYANDTLPGDNPAVSYATVYPLAMFSRVIIAQLILMIFLT
jgi:AspT/YidE/YbjL antiporter-like protein